MEIKNKKTVGILTFFDGINHGAFLQCYGLYKKVEKMGYKVKIISYKNPIHWIKEYKIFLWTKRVNLLIKNIKKIAKFKKEQKKIPKTRFKLVNRNIPYFDNIIIGSDIVWNYKNPLFGKDLIYFGYKLKTENLISYAPSFGSIREHFLPKIIKEHLKKFKKISVRDENSKIILDKNNIISELVLDPTFLYDFGKEAIIPTEEKYILVYAFTINEESINQIKKFSRERKLKIISIGYKQDWSDKDIVDVSPFEWVGYFKKADYIITSTFHGTIFSLKFKKSFYIIPNEPINNKIEYILKQLNQKGRIFIKGKEIKDILNLGYDKDYDKKLSSMIRESEKYLTESLI
ncbi:polysaccharide pyruvyl transferase family protein [Candidatus Parcubacteria bacterium]|nr:polysaccharide pyruvyl transferase family protein [Candidatus Parcubacteria bacterium]